MVRSGPLRADMSGIASTCIGLFIVLTALAALGLEQKAGSSHGDIEKQQILRAYSSGPTSPTNPFLPIVPYDTGAAEVLAMAVADVNHDGKLDLVIVNNNGGYPSLGDSSIGVLLGNGDGTFQPVVVYDTGTTGATSVAVGDVNNDGKPDVVVASSGSVSVFLGNGDGSFKPAAVYSSGGVSTISPLTPILLADLNGDGKLDVIVATQTNSTGGNGCAAVLLNNGDGTFQSGKTYDSGGFYTSSVAVADLNADGIQDLVVVNCAASGSASCFDAGGTVGVLLGNGDGTFHAVRSYARGGWGASWSPVKVADVNGDGKPDILVGNACEVKFVGEDGHCTNDGSVGVFTGNGDGTFRPAVTYDTGGGDAASIVLADIDGDGKLDLVVENGSNPAVLRGRGDGTFRYPDQYTSAGIMPGSAVLVADVNGDGKPDLIGSGATSIDFIWVLLGNGSGFTDAFTYMTGYGLSQAVVEDVNSDGRPDLLAVYGCSNYYGCNGIDGTVGVQLSNPGFVYNSTTTRVTSNVDPAPPNQAITYTVSVTNPAGTAVTGDVSCYGKNMFEDKTLVNNQAVFSITYPTPSTHQIQCSYTGDSENLGSTSLNLSQLIRLLPVPSKTTITTSGSPSHVGQAVTFTARVTSPDGSIPDGELITFFDAKTVLGSVPLSAGTAELTTSFALATKHLIKAVYGGDGTFKAGQQSIVQVVTQ